MPIASSHLLPEPLRPLVCEKKAKLNPFYPLEFEVDPFGAVFDSEYIAKIPFVDENLLSKEYEKVIAHAPFTADDILRNELHDSYRYTWDNSMQEYEVASSLPMYFENFKAKVKTESFQLEKLKFDPKAIFDTLPQGAFKYHRSFPSLHFIKEVSSRMEKYSRRDVTFYKCCLNITPKYDEKNEKALEE